MSESLTGINANPILKTKLKILHANTQVIARSRLVEKLGSSANIQQLTIICAPAGFGKTT